MKLKSVFVCTVFAAAALISPEAGATVIENVTMNFASGAVFTGQVTFADDFSYVTDVSGTLTGYQYGTSGYVGSGSDSINWIYANGFNYSTGSNNYSTFLMDGPGDGYTAALYYNWIQFAYNYSSAPVLSFTSGQSAVDYYDPSVSGSISPIPEPATVALFGSGLGIFGLLGWRRRKKAAARAAG